MNISIAINTITRGLMAAGINGSSRAGVPTPSLDLDFINSETLDPRITFSRTTNATRINSQGLIEYAPHNLLTFSEQFDNAAWAKNNGATVTANTTTAPDGTTTADTFTTGALASSGVFRFPTTTASTTHTLSVYLKNSSGSTNIRFGCDANPANACIRFNPTTGLITSSEANVTASNVVDAGNGWYRISVSFVTTSTAPGIILYGMTGTVVSFHAWGAQLNVGALQPYYPTTVKNLLGFSEAFENAAWTKSNSFIQTNLLLNSATLVTQNVTTAAVPYTLSFFGTGTVTLSGTSTAGPLVGTGANDRVTLTFTPTAGTLTLTVSGSVTSAQLVQGSTAGDYQQTFSAALPVMYKAPNGLMTADKLVETTAASIHVIENFATLVSGTTYTSSVSIKPDGRPTIQMVLFGTAFTESRTWFDLSTGVATTTIGTIVSASIVSQGDGWYRVSVTQTATASGIGTISFRLWNGSTALYTGDGTSGIYIWGAQLSDSASLDTYVNNPGAAPTSTAYYGHRKDYDPVTLQPKGLLIEEQRVNYCLWSEDFTQATWSKSNTTATGNTEVAPNGLTTADTITATADNGTIRQAITTTAVAFTFSVYLKRKTGTGSVAITMDGTTWVDQTITSTGWTRCIVTQTGVAGTSNPGIRLAVNGDEVYAWGAQAE